MKSETYETDHIFEFSIPEGAIFIDVTKPVTFYYPTHDDECDLQTGYTRYTAELQDNGKWKTTYSDSDGEDGCDTDIGEITAGELINAIRTELSGGLSIVTVGYPNE